MRTIVPASQTSRQTDHIGLGTQALEASLGDISGMVCLLSAAWLRPNIFSLVPTLACLRVTVETRHVRFDVKQGRSISTSTPATLRVLPSTCSSFTTVTPINWGGKDYAMPIFRAGYHPAALA